MKTTQMKVAISEAADAALSTILDRVNTGFLGGKVAKMDLASWMIQDFLIKLDDAKLEAVRKSFFNELYYLESVVKLNRRNGQSNLLPEQLATLKGLLAQRSEKQKATQFDLMDPKGAKGGRSVKSSPEHEQVSESIGLQKLPNKA